MSLHIVFGGPSNCGKSTLVASLYTELLSRGANVGVHEIDVYSDTLDCILGHKPWSERRKRTKAWFNPTIKRRISEFADDASSLVLGDLPGKITNQYIRHMVEPADGAVLVARDWEGLMLWQRHLTRIGVPIVARVISSLRELPLVPPDQPDIFFVSSLDRTVQRSDEVAALASTLLEQVQYRITNAAE